MNLLKQKQNLKVMHIHQQVFTDQAFAGDLLGDAFANADILHVGAVRYPEIQMDEYKLSSQLKLCSINYLTSLYQQFEPDMIVITTGSSSPYCFIIQSFLKDIHSDLELIPTDDNFVVSNEDHTIFWTSHPLYLKVAGQYQQVVQTIKEKVLK